MKRESKKKTSMSSPELKRLLSRTRACYPALVWVRRKGLAMAWEKCGRADWMLWLAARMGVPRAVVRTAAMAVEPIPSDPEYRAAKTADLWMVAGGGVNLDAAAVVRRAIPFEELMGWYRRRKS